jgi:ATP-binding cassette subfamily B protein
MFSGLGGEAYDRKYSDRQLVRRIVNYFQPHRRQVIIISIAIVCMALLGAAPLLIIRQGVEILADGGDQTLIPLLVGIVFFVGVANWGANWVRRQLTSKVIADVILTMRSDAFEATARQDLSFHDQFSSGRIVSRITSDTEAFGEVIILATDVINQVAVALILLATLFSIQVSLTLAVLVMAPFVAMAALGFRRLARAATVQGSRAMGEVNKSIQEAVTGISVAKNFRQELAIYNDFTLVNREAYDINVQKGKVLAGIFPVLNTLSGVGTSVLIYYGGLSVQSGLIILSEWYLFVATIDRFWFPVTNLSAFWSQFQAGLAAAERIFALIDADAAVVQLGDEKVPALSGKITFDHVRFSYNNKETVLPNFSMTIAAGESVAFVGHTGAGKSSIIKLVARFYGFQEGDISIDGMSIRHMNLTDYRRQLGIVSQIPFLFAGTVADNIRYGKPDINDADILTMAQRIGNGEWLETLPDGLNSQVGERGSRLSMGQRQLVALVRVLVQAPRIFILDEATANIDPFTEAQIQEALNLVMSDRTSIIIAHRLSTVRAADRIVVLNKGDIIEQGDHNALMAQNGHYADLYDTYFRHQSLAYIEEAHKFQTSQG